MKGYGHMTAHAFSLNDHLELETEKNPNRSYFAILRGNQPQFSIGNLQADIQAEAEYWMTMLPGSDGKSFLQVFESVQHVFDALKHEGNALKDAEKALDAHKQAEWGEASKYYASALSDLHFAISDWNFVIHEVGDDSPFDPYYPSKAEREKNNTEEPPRASYADMCEISPLLFRIFHNIDRLFCVGQELVQRQMTCLTVYMREAESQHAASREERAAEYRGSQLD
jgi:hypothetical protein